jgi:hypothetical protein
VEVGGHTKLVVVHLQIMHNIITSVGLFLVFKGTIEFKFKGLQKKEDLLILGYREYKKLKPVGVHSHT